MSQAKFSLGIDLGTSNCALSVCDIESDDLRIVNIGQTLRPNQFGELETMPSATYLAHGDEFTAEAITPPWSTAEKAQRIIGNFAREHGALVPDRLVLSAKSWLSNPHSDPRKPTLPFMADLADDEKMAAFDATVGIASCVQKV